MASAGVLENAVAWDHQRSYSDVTADNEWSPLPKIARGTAVGRYSPSVDTAVPGIDSSVDVGDELYVFESHNTGKWYRGYIVSPPRAQSAFNQPLPRSNQRLNNAALKPLDFDVGVGIFPAGIVSLKESFELTQDSISRAQNSLALQNDNDSTMTQIKPSPPAIPALKLENNNPTIPNEPLVDDIPSVINEWYNTYVYHHFLHGNYRLVQTIQDAIRDLYEIRRKLVYNLVTRNERIIARKKAIWQIARVTKLLNRGIIVRDTTSGEILSGNEGPVRLAQEQMLLALAPNYPDHAVVGDYLTEATMPKHILCDFKSCAGQLYGHGLTLKLHLRSKTHRLTESFHVKVKQETSIAEISAVLFRDLPVAIAKDDVYLVAILYEDVPLRSQQPTPISSLMGTQTQKGTRPVGTQQQHQQQQQQTSGAAGTPRLHISHGRRGVAAGAADISRLFRMVESVESPFTIRMYATYFDKGDPSDDNRGWGELVDRIIRGRPFGV